MGGCYPATVLQIVLKPHGDNYDMVSPFPNDDPSALAPLIHVCSSSTVGEAQASVDQLATLIRRLVETNHDMSQRMARMEMRTVGFTPSTAPTVFTADEHPSPIDPHTETSSDDESFLTIRQLESAFRALGNTDAKPGFRFAFEQDLITSRSYTRAMKRPPRWSARSSAVCTVGWSCLSGLSLADVTVISVISLPISAGELWDGQRYSNSFAASKGALEGITEEDHCARTVSRQGPESSQGSDSRTRTESRMGSISRLGSISPTSNRDAANGKSSSFQTVKTLLGTRNESPNRKGSRTPSISIGESGIPIAVLPRKIALLCKI